MKQIFLTIWLGLMVVSGTLMGQRMNDLKEYFIPPELIMRNRSALDLSDGQRDRIVEEVKKARAKFVEVEWSLDEEVEKLRAILDATVVDETTALAQMDKVLDLERSLKRTQALLSIRIRNILTAEQLAKVHALRPQEPTEALPGGGARRPRPPFRRP